MIINVRGQKLKVTDAIKSHIESKLVKLEKFFDNPSAIKANVLIKVQGENQIIEVTIPMGRLILRAEEKHYDLYAAIDLVVDKLDSQIRKNKSRLKDKYKDESTLFYFDDNIQATEENKEAKIVKRKNVELKPMDEEEAILQMELLNHDFFLFNNIDQEGISVIYKRKDGQYGILDAN